MRRLFRRANWDEERRLELEHYLELETETNIARGMTPDQARAAACRKLGNPTRIREEIHDMATLRPLETVWQDVRTGVRALRASPMFTAAAVVSLMLGIGATTAIFQLLNAVRLRPLPVSRAHELVEVRITNAPGGRKGRFVGSQPMMTHAIWTRVSETGTLDRPFAWSATTFDLSTGGESRFVNGLWASGGLFDALDLRPVHGRLLTAADDSPACASRSVVLSEPFWQLEFGGRPDVIGTSLRLDGEPFQIIGVSPAAFFGLEVGRRFDVAVPICAIDIVSKDVDALARKDFWWLSIMGRLRPGSTIDSTTAQLTAAAPGIFAATVPDGYTPEEVKGYLAYTLTAFPAGSGVSQLRVRYEQPLWILLAIAGFVLLIAAANLANLLLARAAAREREMAVRLAMGASRGRLVHQLLVESLLLSLTGAAFGALVARGLSQLLVARLSTTTTPRFLDLSLDWRLLAFTAGLALLTTVLFGLAPALRATRTPPGSAMKLGTRVVGSGGGRSAVRRLLIAGQVALSFVLVMAAVLFGRTLGNLDALDPGFEEAGVTVATFNLRGADLPPDRLPLVQQQLLERIRILPGVESASSVEIVPLLGSSWNQSLFVDGVQQDGYPKVNRVSPAYFDLMRIPLIAGRTFLPEDTALAPLVAVITRAFAEKYLGTPQPLGRTFQFETGPLASTYRVVGVAGDTKYDDLRAPVEPIAYLPDTQMPASDVSPMLSVVVRARERGFSVRPAITAALRETYPTVLVNFRELSDVIDATLVRERLMATLSGFFGALAALLAAVGLYGVMSYLVSQRRAEFGIRLALGARPAGLRWMVLREAGRLVTGGLAAGLLVAIAAGRAAESLLFGLQPRDGAALATSAAVLLVSALAATAIPAGRAAAVAPTIALRE